VKANAKGNLKSPGESAYFIAVSQLPNTDYVFSDAVAKVNRNKKSIGLSFQHPEGVKILHELAKTSDVLVENYIPGLYSYFRPSTESSLRIQDL
jgi:crotonobetainyl-CoA:carnitine CoA-transferase CaiB-like acyl-CoA transferase